MPAPTSSLSPIEKVLHRLRSSSGPVTELLHGNGQFKVIVLGFNKGDVLPDHTTDRPTTLTVLNGCVLYRDDLGETPLFDYDSHTIPVDQVHSVQAARRSICLLSKG